MGFALDNAEASKDIVQVLTESLKLKETAGPTKVARLFLVSDILHNSSAPVKNATSYRTLFQEHLPDILESCNLTHASLGRMSANAMMQKVSCFESL
jgi:U2-associated protein SR140